MKIVLDDVEQAALAVSKSLIGPIRRQLHAAKDLAEVSLDYLPRTVNSALQSEQLTLSRLIVPFIEKVMTPAYKVTLDENGSYNLTSLS